jgi:ketosteroid isomerase-like protein
MKQTMVVCVLAACALSAFGQAKSDAPKSGASVEQALMQMERDWTKAGLEKDTATLDKIMADDWTAIDYQGKTVTKAQSIADLKAGSSTLTTVTLGEMKVRVFGNTAVVTGSDTEKSTYKGKDSSGKYVWMDVFVNRGGKWQAVASESTKAVN